LARFVRRLDPEIRAAVDQADAGYADRVVDPRLGLRATRRLERASPRPQICFTELVMSSFGNEKTADRQRQIISTNLVG
jgi:hypothetical protein